MKNKTYTQFYVNLDEIKEIIDNFRINEKCNFLTTDIITEYKTNSLIKKDNLSDYSVYALWSIFLMNHNNELGICQTKIGVPVLKGAKKVPTCSEWEIINKN